MFAIEERIKGGWQSTMYSDGTQIVCQGNTEKFRLFWNTTIDDNYIMPEYVRHMLYEQRDAHRHCFRLHRSYRLPVLFAKHKVRVRWYPKGYRFMWRKFALVKWPEVCNPSDYLPV